jgi:hypothetical protein
MSIDSIVSLEQLREIYAAPMELVTKKQLTKLDSFSKKFLALSPFAVLSTSGLSGFHDSSPRGDGPGFMLPIDDVTLAIPDRPGNNRLDTLSNIVENPNIGILCLVPGFSECLRINGSAKISINPELLARFEHNGKLPASVILVSIAEVYFHCAKAIVRAQLWENEAKVSREELPSLGRILMAQISPEKSESDIQKIEDLVEDRLKNTLY